MKNQAEAEACEEDLNNYGDAPTQPPASNYQPLMVKKKKGGFHLSKGSPKKKRKKEKEMKKTSCCGGRVTVGRNHAASWVRKTLQR